MAYKNKKYPITQRIPLSNNQELRIGLNESGEIEESFIRDVKKKSKDEIRVLEKAKKWKEEEIKDIFSKGQPYYYSDSELNLKNLEIKKLVLKNL